MNNLKIPKAFNFSDPKKSNSTLGRWVVHYMREHFTKSVNDHAYFWRKCDALAFVTANREGKQ